MEYFTSNPHLIKKIIQAAFIIIGFVLIFIVSFSLDLDLKKIREKMHLPLLLHEKLNKTLSVNKQKVSISFFPGYNSTHLWSMRFADENYFHLARLLPCRIVEYTGGPNIDKIDSCNHSSTNEFSIENTLEAQKWIYEHQHPTDCTNKRLAVIHTFAWSGFGSTVHQIVWAFGAAIGDNRIAVYRTPGNWVR